MWIRETQNKMLEIKALVQHRTHSQSLTFDYKLHYLNWIGKISGVSWFECFQSAKMPWALIQNFSFTISFRSDVLNASIAKTTHTHSHILTQHRSVPLVVFFPWFLLLLLCSNFLGKLCQRAFVCANKNTPLRLVWQNTRTVKSLKLRIKINTNNNLRSDFSRTPAIGVMYNSIMNFILI